MIEISIGDAIFLGVAWTLTIFLVIAYLYLGPHKNLKKDNEWYHLITTFLKRRK